jgi:ubiquinone/menaquinone biosynthesis C-methylase UbiE
MSFGIWVAATFPLLAAQDETPDLDVPYVPTHKSAVNAMLKLARVTAKDYVIDLGCGDGRIVIAAARKHGARGLGVDLDPKRIAESKQNASKAGVTGLVRFEKADIMDTDLRHASVVMLFLLDEVNLRLRPKLFAELKPGTRVVSNSFHMADWEPDKEVRHKKAFDEVIYLWIIPAPVAGMWTWRTKLRDMEITNELMLEQEFQTVQGTIALPGAAGVPVTKAVLSGAQLRFRASLRIEGEPVAVAYHGRADGDVIRGTQKWLGGPYAGTYPWQATRKPVALTGRWQIRAPSLSECNGTLCIRREAVGHKAAYVLDNEPKKEHPLQGFYTWGSSVRFEVPSGEDTVPFKGSFGAGSGSGTASRDRSQKRTAWSAKRLAG